MPKYSPFTVEVYHKNKKVGTERVMARDIKHAHHMGGYIAGTVAREAVHPSDFDRSRVHFRIPSASDTASDSRTNADMPTRLGG